MSTASGRRGRCSSSAPVTPGALEQRVIVFQGFERQLAGRLSGDGGGAAPGQSVADLEVLLQPPGQEA